MLLNALQVDHRKVHKSVLENVSKPSPSVVPKTYHHLASTWRLRVMSFEAKEFLVWIDQKIRKPKCRPESLFWKPSESNDRGCTSEQIEKYQNWEIPKLWKYQPGSNQFCDCENTWASMVVLPVPSLPTRTIGEWRALFASSGLLEESSDVCWSAVFCMSWAILRRISSPTGLAR